MVELEEILTEFDLRGYNALKTNLENNHFSEEETSEIEIELEEWADCYDAIINDIKGQLDSKKTKGIIVNDRYYPQERFIGKMNRNILRTLTEELTDNSEEMFNLPSRKVAKYISAPFWVGGLIGSGIGHFIEKITKKETASYEEMPGSITKVVLPIAIGATTGIATIIGLSEINTMLGITYVGACIGSLGYTIFDSSRYRNNLERGPERKNIENLEKEFYQPFRTSINERLR